MPKRSFDMRGLLGRQGIGAIEGTQSGLRPHLHALCHRDQAAPTVGCASA
jgi:hypothetical protein